MDCACYSLIAHGAHAAHATHGLRMLLTDSSWCSRYSRCLRHSWIAHGFYQQDFYVPISSHIVGLVGLVAVVALVTVVGLVNVVSLVSLVNLH